MFVSQRRHELESWFNRLIAEHGPAISRLAYGYESIAGFREELVQEIAFAIWRALPHFRGECSERTFVYRIAHNRGLSHASRRKPAAEPLEDLQASQEPVDPHSDPAEQVVRTHQHVQLMSAIQSLALGYRQIVVLMLEGLTQGEIAEVLGITENNVAVRLNRARYALRQVLGVKS